MKTGTDSRPKVLLHLPTAGALPGLSRANVMRLRRELPSVEWVECADDASFQARLPECSGAVVWDFLPEWLERAPKLSLVSTPAAGRDWVLVRPRPGLAVEFGTFHGELIAETVLGLMLAFARGIRHGMEVQRATPWARAEVAAGMRSLRGASAVVLGFGHIGKWIGRLLKPMGIRVTGVNRRDLERPEYFDAGDTVVSIDELDVVLPEADHLVLALPGGGDTDKIIDARRLALLPERAVVYNIGRGNSIDMPALVAALRSGAIAGAGLDVFDEEPLPAGAPIRTCPNVVLMPHVSAFAPNYMDLYINKLLPLVHRHILGGATGEL